jgi:hypothetical protein
MSPRESFRAGTQRHDVPAVLNEFARCIRPDGSLLLGFFDDERVEALNHAVITAYCWPASAMHHELIAAGFDIVQTHPRSDPGQQPNAATMVRRRISIPVEGSR